MTNKPTPTDLRGDREAQKRAVEEKVDQLHDEDGNLTVEDDPRGEHASGRDQSQQTGRDFGVSQGERQTDGGGAKAR